MMMVHGQAARHKETWRRSDDDRFDRLPTCFAESYCGNSVHNYNFTLEVQNKV